MKDVKFETVEWYNGEFLTVLADKRASRHFNKNYYFTCSQCVNASWCDDSCCNNADLNYFHPEGIKEKVYCSNYDV